MGDTVKSWGQMKQELLYKDLTSKILSAVYDVFENLGYGYKEKIYQNALEKELLKRNLTFARECYGKILYDGEVVGKYYLDFLVEDTVAVELKVRRELFDSDKVQLLEYLKAKHLKVGLLVVFSKEKPIVKRFINSV